MELVHGGKKGGKKDEEEEPVRKRSWRKKTLPVLTMQQ